MIKKRIVSLILVLLLLATTLPVSFAATNDNNKAVDKNNYANGVSTKLGKKQVSNGLTASIKMYGGLEVTGTVAKRDCWTISATKGTNYVGVDIDDSYIHGMVDNVEITVDYYDGAEKGSFALRYKNDDIHTDIVMFTGSNKWTSHTFKFSDISIDNTVANGSDFLVETDYADAEISRQDVNISGITVKKSLHPLKVSTSSYKKGNIFTQNDKLILNVALMNQTNKLEKYELDYSILDGDGLTVKSGKFPYVKVAANSSANTTLNLDDIKKFDTYNLNLKVSSTAGDANKTIVIPFSRVLVENREVVDSFFGVGTHFAFKRDQEVPKYIPETLSQVDQSGATYIRDEMYWSDAELTKGKLEILPIWDEYVNTALEKGIQPLINLGYGNRLYNNGNAPLSKEDVAAYCRYVKFIAEHFKGRVTHYEIWNEYDLNAGQTEEQSPGTAAVYEPMLEAAYKTLKAVYAGSQDKVTVVAGATGNNNVKFISELLDLGAYDYMDAVSVHPYSYPFSPEAYKLDEQMIKLNNLMMENGRAHKPIWISELGFTTNINERGISEELAADYYTKAHVLVASTGVVDKLFTYDFQNDGLDVLETEHNFGLVTSWKGLTVPSAAKRDYVSYCNLTSKLNGMKFKQSYNELDENLKIFRFTSEAADSKASDKLVLWTSGANRSVALDLGCSQVKVSDMYGNKTTVYAVDGKINLSLTSAPAYIEGEIGAYLQVYPSVLTLEKSSFEIAAAGTVKLNADFSGSVPTGSGKYKLELPSGWVAVDDVVFNQGSTNKELSVTVPKDTKNGQYEVYVNVTTADDKVIGSAKAIIKVVDPYQAILTPVPVTVGDWSKWKFQLKVSNNNDFAVTGNVKLSKPIAWANAEAIKLDLAAGETKIIDIPVQGDVNQDLYDVEMKIAFDNDKFINITKKVSFLAATKAETAPTIDGVVNVDEWADSMAFTMDKAEQVKENPNWEGIDDLSGTGYMKWDKDNLYLALTVKDNVQFNSHRDGDIWNGDGLQFTIDPTRAKIPGEYGWNEMGVGLNNYAAIGTTNWRWSAITGKATGAVTGLIASTKRNENEKTTVYELSVPWSEILPEGMAVESGLDLGFSALINENDGAERQGWIEYKDGIGYSKDVGLFGDLVLVDSSK